MNRAPLRRSDERPGAAQHPQAHLISVTALEANTSAGRMFELPSTVDGQAATA
jgi:hypothetical protein